MISELKKNVKRTTAKQNRIYTKVLWKKDMKGFCPRSCFILNVKTVLHADGNIVVFYRKQISSPFTNI